MVTLLYTLLILGLFLKHVFIFAQTEPNIWNHGTFPKKGTKISYVDIPQTPPSPT